jgi:DNA modification methylase
MIIENICALEKIKKLEDNSQDIIFADPPYALGSTVLIGKDGKPYYKEAKDFMSKWEMPDEKFWEEFFIEANRVLKYGGRVLFFGIDRQLMLFQYYGIASGLEIKQSLYWYFISSFPKATDLSKNIDKRLGVERTETCPLSQTGVNITESNTELGKKYQGHKYSIAPLKQVLETVMVFQKITKNKSVLDDVFAYEDGDDTISPSIWDIDNGRVPNDIEIKTNITEGQKLGRFPSQLFIEENMSNVLDKQNDTYEDPKDSGGSSRILHQIGYIDEELDIVIYSAKVSGKERNVGLEDMKDVEVGANNHSNPMGMKNTQINTSSGKERNVTTVTKNNHPTLKPIKLIYNIAKLLKTPNKQRVFFPFSGSGSEIIGFMKAGFDIELFECSELSEDYIEIAHKRIDYWKDVNMDDFINKKEIIIDKVETDAIKDDEW